MEVVVIEKATFERMLSGFEFFAEKVERLCREHAPDIIMTDIKMPLMDGLTAMTCAGCSASAREPCRRCGRTERWLTPR
jgi:DNA-binding NarL/FixJ family response regulator